MPPIKAAKLMSLKKEKKRKEGRDGDGRVSMFNKGTERGRERVKWPPVEK